jgi:hypothetical protein
MKENNIGEGLLEYNTVRDKLLLPEYGRNIQKLINHAKEIKDEAQRQEYVEILIELMNQMIPNSKSAAEIADKLWNHMFYISGYEIEATPPDTVTIHQKGDVFMEPSDDVGYPQKKIPYRHYGWNVHNMIEKALAMEEGPKREEFAKVIASYMKLAYRTWGKEQFVNDELIKEDLKKMSQGKIEVSDDANIDNYKNVTLNGGNSQRNKKHYKGSNQQGQHNRRYSGGRPGGKKKKRY